MLITSTILAGSILGGLAFLFLGGHYLVKHAVLLAEKLGISPLVISMTVVAFGTSAPELVVSIDALLNDYSGLVLGNIIGSNFANMLLVLPVGAIIYPLIVSKSIVWREGGVMLAATAVFSGLCLMGELSFLAGVVLLLGLTAFMVFSIFYSKMGHAEDHDQHQDQSQPFNSPSAGVGVKDGVIVILALLALALGSRLFVEGAVDLSRILGVSEAVIGLTVVAVGTSAPELITVAIAAWQKQTDVVIGNVLGSNIFNLLGIGGVAAMVAPIAVDAHFIEVDLPILALTSMALVVLALMKARIGRGSGLCLLAGYIGYTYYLF